MSHGGKRPGAGRRPGSKNTHPAGFRDRLLRYCQKRGIHPHYFMAEVITREDVPMALRLRAAAELARYLEPKLNATEHSGRLEILEKLQRLNDCTDEELQQIIDYAEDVARRGRA